MLEKLRALNLDRTDLDEAVELYAFGTGIQNAYSKLGLEQPSWIDDSMVSLTNNIESRRRDNLERELKEATTQLEGLKTAAEKREELAKKMERLKKALGKDNQTQQA